MTDTSPNPGQDLLRAALDCMGEGVFIVDADGKILFFSARAEALTGIRSSDIVGQECSSALRGGVCGIDQAVLRGVPLDHEEFDFILPDGHPLRVHRTVRPITSSDGNHLGTVVTFHVPGSRSPAVGCEPRASSTDNEALHQFVGRSEALRKVADTVRRVAALEHDRRAPSPGIDLGRTRPTSTGSPTRQRRAGTSAVPWLGHARSAKPRAPRTSFRYARVGSPI